MKISDLKAGQGNIDVEVVVKELEETRTFNKFGRQLRVRNVIVEDDSGFVKLTLWNDDVDKFAVGEKIKLSKGYVNEFQGEKQLTTGKFGKIEKIGEGSVKIPSDSSTSMEEPEEAAGITDTSSKKNAKKELEAEEELEEMQEEEDY